MAKPKSKIVEATGVASSVSNDGPNSKTIQEAMAKAAAEAQAEGIGDPDVIRDRMLAARKAVKQG